MNANPLEMIDKVRGHAQYNNDFYEFLALCLRNEPNERSSIGQLRESNWYQRHGIHEVNLADAISTCLEENEVIKNLCKKYRAIKNNPLKIETCIIKMLHTGCSRKKALDLN